MIEVIVDYCFSCYGNYFISGNMVCYFLMVIVG